MKATLYGCRQKKKVVERKLSCLFIMHEAQAQQGGTSGLLKVSLLRWH
jgi:hypothetical protein